MKLTQIKAFITVFIWGAGFVFTKYALASFTPVFVVFVRFGIGSLMLGATVLHRREFKLPPLKELPYLMLTGFIGVTFHQWLQATGLLTASATTTAWIVSIIPVITFILGVLFLKENGSLFNLAGILVSFLGIVWVVSQGEPLRMFGGSFTSSGDFLILLSAFNWAFFSILSRRGLKTYPPALMMLYVMFFGWVLSGIWMLADPAILPADATVSVEAALSLAALGIFGSGLAYIFWYDALKELAAYELSVFIYIEPIVTMVLAALMIGEKVTLPTMIGGALTILGIVMVNRKAPSPAAPISIADQKSEAE